MLSDEVSTKQIDLTDHVQGQSKVERYKWRSDARPGELAYVNKTLLVADDEYQRAIGEARVFTMARDFSWPAFGAITVAKRPGDKLYKIIDGQHRWAIAMKRADIKEVPCVIFKMDDIVEEATAFVAANTNRRPIRAVERYKADVVRGDEATLLVDELLRNTKREIAGYDGAKVVRCVACMVNWARRRPDLLRKMWTLIDQVADGVVVTNVLVEGLLYIEQHMEDGTSLLDAKWSKRLRHVGATAMERRAKAMAMAYAKGGAKAWALGMIEEINKNLREQGHLALRETKAS